jgi:DNA-binding CsgD family transcriptional regulator/tetratricopeptide (TPR) repeat protein
MADGDKGTPVAGRMIQPTVFRPLLRQASGQRRGPGMVDRQEERAAIERVLDSVRKGFSGTLMLQGGPGTGKTMLLEYAIDSAPDLRISSVIGVESEISLEFAALHQLLVPFMALLPALPAPQRDAMKIAFGLEEGPPPDLFLVGLAALTLLSRAAEDQALLCVIDDGQWLDRESAHALGFVARRLYADRVAIIATVGESPAPEVIQQLPIITVGGLPDAEARALLGSVIDGPLDAQVADRILADTHNNPLAIVELGTEYTAEQLAGHASLPEPLPVGQRLKDRFLRQVRELPPGAQAFVLLAAADVSGERSWLWRAATQAGIDPDTAAAAAADVLELSDNQVRFRHPLLRSAVYHGAADADRRRAHAALSETAGAGAGLDQCTWHRAAAATAPDEELATEVQQAAERARGHGGYAAAAALLRRSAELTPADGARAEREVALAGAELRVGHTEQARELAGAAIPRLTDDVARGMAKRLNGEIRFAEGSAAEAAGILADASRELAPDGRLARDTILEALEAAIWAGPGETRQIATAAQSFPPASSPPTVTDLLLEGYCARSTAGYGASVGPLRAAVAALRAEDLDPAVGLRWFALGVQAAGSLWDERAVCDLSGRMVRTARALGALTILPVALAFLAISDWLTGRFGDADAQWAEKRELLAETRRPQMLGTDSRADGIVLAYRGHLTEAHAAGIAQIHESTARGQVALTDIGRYIVTVADLFGGDYDAATSTALSVVDDDTAFTAEASLPELIEAATRAGHHQAAATAYDTLSQRALAAGTPWALGVRARCQALLDEDGTAEDAYQESLRQLARSRVTIELARTHLLYGQWLRRAKRRKDARQELRTAQDMYAAMGADHFTEEARTELRATGERARARIPETTYDLTPQEAHIAGLAAGGASNNEIAAHLFISPSTVDYHLRKVYRKLNVTSRIQLARSLGPAPESTWSGDHGSRGH